jgi:hypothetical protein
LICQDRDSLVLVLVEREHVSRQTGKRGVFRVGGLAGVWEPLSDPEWIDMEETQQDLGTLLTPTVYFSIGSRLARPLWSLPLTVVVRLLGANTD